MLASLRRHDLRYRNCEHGGCTDYQPPACDGFSSLTMRSPAACCIPAVGAVGRSASQHTQCVCSVSAGSYNSTRLLSASSATSVGNVAAGSTLFLNRRSVDRLQNPLNTTTRPPRTNLERCAEARDPRSRPEGCR